LLATEILICSIFVTAISLVILFYCLFCWKSGTTSWIIINSVYFR